jgi:hypothetical protein
MVKDICLPTFNQEYKNLLERLATVQVIQLTNLFKTIFSNKPGDKDDEGPLIWLMSLYVFPQKFVKGHLNVSFQSDELKFALLYKSTSINPFQYAPQTNQASVTAARKDMKEQRNKLNFQITETQRKKTTTNIEGIGRITTMDDIAITTANIC